jgi:hypothetical protein
MPVRSGGRYIADPAGGTRPATDDEAAAVRGTVSAPLPPPAPAPLPPALQPQGEEPPPPTDTEAQAVDRKRRRPSQEA